MTASADRKVVPISKVREWARRNGENVGNRGHVSGELIQRFNRAHRSVKAENNNPMLKAPDAVVE